MFRQILLPKTTNNFLEVSLSSFDNMVCYKLSLHTKEVLRLFFKNILFQSIGNIRQATFETCMLFTRYLI